MKWEVTFAACYCETEHSRIANSSRVVRLSDRLTFCHPAQFAHPSRFRKLCKQTCIGGFIIQEGQQNRVHYIHAGVYTESNNNTAVKLATGAKGLIISKLLDSRPALSNGRDGTKQRNIGSHTSVTGGIQN